MKKIALILTLIFSITLLSGCKPSVMSPTNQPTSHMTAAPTAYAWDANAQSTDGNLANAGLVVYKDNWIYFSNGDDNGTLYKMHLDGSEKTKLNDVYSFGLNTDNEWVYYYRYIPDKVVKTMHQMLYKIRTDGTEETLLLEQGQFATLRDGWIYFTDNGIYRIKTDGTERTLISEVKASSICLAGERIYFSNSDDNWYLYMMRMDGTEKTLLVKDRASGIMANGGYIYYLYKITDANGGNVIYRIGSDGSGHIELNKKKTAYFNIADEWIYYSGYDPERYGEYFLYRMHTDGTGEELFDSLDSTKYEINIAGGWVFYNKNKKRIRLDGTGMQSMQAPTPVPTEHPNRQTPTLDPNPTVDPNLFYTDFKISDYDYSEIDTVGPGDKHEWFAYIMRKLENVDAYRLDSVIVTLEIGLPKYPNPQYMLADGIIFDSPSHRLEGFNPIYWTVANIIDQTKEGLKNAIIKLYMSSNVRKVEIIETT